MTDTHTLKFVCYQDHVESLGTPTIYTVTLDHVDIPEDLLSLKDSFYHGVVTDIPRETLEPFLENLEKLDKYKVDMDHILANQTTVCMLLDNKVLFLDMLCNSDNFTDHPFTAIGKAYMVRDKLDRLFPAQNLEYLPQCPKWFEKQATYYKEQKESKKKIETQLELLRLLSGKTSTS